MKIYKVGDQGKGICEACERMVSTTYQVRNLPLSEGNKKVMGALSIVCDSCDAVIGFPHQSLHRVQAVVKQEQESVDSRVPVQIEDIFNLVCEKLSTTYDFKASLIRFYAQKMAESVIPVSEITDLLKDSIVSGKSTCRLSVKGSYVRSHFKAIEKAAHLRSNADVMKAIAIRAKRDVLDGGSKKMLKELKDIVAIS